MYKVTKHFKAVSLFDLFFLKKFSDDGYPISQVFELSLLLLDLLLGFCEGRLIVDLLNLIKFLLDLPPLVHDLLVIYLQLFVFFSQEVAFLS
jgi:hypothetical protein